MNCREIKDRLHLLVGILTPDDSIKEHLESCPDCRKYFEELRQLENTMKSVPFEPLSAAESALVQERLDDRIGRFLNRAVGFYRLMVPYGTSLAAICLLLFISFVSDFNLKQNRSGEVGSSYVQLTDNSSDSENEYLEEGYVDDLFYDYVQSHGSYSGQLLLGDLYEDEYEYLDKNIDVGDIL